MTRQSPYVCLSIACALLCPTAARAALVQVDASDSGFYLQTGTHIPTSEYYFTGVLFSDEHRSFFVFDLPGVPGVITGATLHLYNPFLSTFQPGFKSPDASETLVVYDVSTPVATVTAGGAGLVGIWNDLGSGTVFGARDVSSADNDTTIAITLNAAALAALNAAIGGQIAFGGALSTVVGTADQFVFAFATADFVPIDVRRLDLTVTEVPEPGLLALLLLALAMRPQRR